MVSGRDVQSERDGGIAGFRRLLERADKDDEARSRVLDLLAERSVWAAAWPGSPELLRTLHDGKGEQAIALFSAEDTLRTAAEQLGWLASDGSHGGRELLAYDALTAAIAQGMACIVIDVGSDHVVELGRDEVALMLAVLQKQRGKTSVQSTPKKIDALTEIDIPFVGGRPDSIRLRPAARPVAVAPKAPAPGPAPAPAPKSKPTEPRAQPAAPTPARSKPTEPSRPRAHADAAPAEAPAPKPAEPEPKPVAEARANAEAATSAPAAPTETAPEREPAPLRPLEVGLSEAVLSALSDALRAFPEVEWACEVSDGTEVPVIGVRVSPEFMTRVDEIERAVLAAGSARKVALRVLGLHDAARMKEARAQGEAFFPWRKRGTRK